MFYNPTDSGAVQLKADNLDMTLGNYENGLNASDEMCLLPVAIYNL